jgi:predicted transcriptional regulator
LDSIKNISKIELEILNIAKKLTQKRPLRVDALYREAKKLKYPIEDINKAIYNLILKKIIVPKRKIVKTQVLANDNRDKIYNYILNNPGAHLREIRDGLDLQPHLANLHLKVLEDFEFIYQRKYLKYRVYFPSLFDAENEAPILALKNEKAVKIFMEILNKKEVSINELKDHFSEIISPQMVDYHLEPLIESNLISNIQKNGIELYTVNQPILNKIKRFIATKIGLEIEKPVVVKRAYDYVGGNIRFKIVVENISSFPVEDIRVELDTKEQFEVQNSIQSVALLDPEESRGVDFMLSPLACGKSNVQGMVSYQDYKGDLYSSEVKPVLVQIKCPLVQSRILKMLDILKMKDKFQVSRLEIPYEGMQKNIAYKIAKDQVASLDLAEIEGSMDQSSALFSGEAKITRNSILVDLNVDENKIKIDVYMGNLKEATGFLAYIKNLISMSLDYSEQISISSEKISTKIFNSFEFGLRLLELFDLCSIRETIEDLLVLVKELQIKSNTYFPELKLTEPIENWFDQLEAIQGSNVFERTYLNLQFDILSWMEDIIVFSETNSKIYFESLAVDENTRNKILQGNMKLNNQYKLRQYQYSMSILYALLFIHKNFGLSVYNHNFSGEMLDSDLISGFLTAIQSFGSEFTKQETKMKKLSYEHFEIQLTNGKYITAALITTGYPNQITINSVAEVLERFENKYRYDLENFSGKVTAFRDAGTIIQEIFTR